MASEQATVAQIAAAMGGAGEIRTRKMFGEHAVYCDDRLVALVCDDQLYVKVTDAGRALLGDAAATAPPYPGAKAHFLIAEESWRDPALLSDLAAMTARSLPPPNEKRKKKR